MLGVFFLGMVFLGASLPATAIATTGPFSKTAPPPTAAAPPYLANAGMAAQHPAENTGPAPEQANSKTNSEDNDVNIYRHSPMVQSIAHLLRLPVETTARIFEALNFLVLAFAILWFVLRALPKMLRERAERIQRDLQNARKATEDAQQRLQDVEQRLARLDAEIADLKSQAERETVTDEARIRAAMEAEQQRMVHAAEQEVLSTSANAQRRLKLLAADLIVQYATQHVAPSTDVDHLLVRNFVSDIDKKDGKGGGAN
jgi:F-type H+-transporting ATPase subunit b